MAINHISKINNVLVDFVEKTILSKYEREMTSSEKILATEIFNVVSALMENPLLYKTLKSEAVNKVELTNNDIFNIVARTSTPLLGIFDVAGFDRYEGSIVARNERTAGIGFEPRNERTEREILSFIGNRGWLIAV